jgi:hypothetical protein
MLSINCFGGEEKMMKSGRGTVYIAIAFLCLFSQCSIAAMVDLTTVGSQGVIDGAIFNQINPTNSSGSGVFDSFLRISNSGTERGYNTDGTIEFDTLSSFTHSLLLSAVPVVTINGTVYREFCLDINQNGQQILSLDELKIHVESTGNMSGYPGSFSTPIYDLGSGNWVKMDYSLNAGSGKADIDVLVPSALFGTDNNKYVYLYSVMGVNGSADDGFEEWGVGADSVAIIIPEPVTFVLLGLGGLMLRKRK